MHKDRVFVYTPHTLYVYIYMYIYTYIHALIPITTPSGSCEPYCAYTPQILSACGTIFNFCGGGRSAANAPTTIIGTACTGRVGYVDVAPVAME